MKKKAATAAVVVILIGTSATFAYLYFRADNLQKILADKVAKVEQDLSVTNSDLWGYTRYTESGLRGPVSGAGARSMIRCVQ